MNRLLVVVGFVCCLSVFTCHPSDSSQSFVLEVDTPVDSPGPGLVVHNYLLNCSKGSIEDIRVTQIGVDIDLEIRDSNNQVLLQWDSPYSHHGEERVVFRVPHDGGFFLRLVARNPNQKGRYQVERRTFGEDGEQRLRIFEQQAYAERLLQRDAKQGMATLQSVIEGWQSLNEPMIAAMASWRLAIFCRASQPKKALAIYEQTLSLLESANAWRVAAIVRYFKADIHYRLGELQPAIELFQQALTQEDVQAGNRADMLRYLGVAYISFGETQKSLHPLQQALAMNQELERKPELAVTYGSLGWYYHNMGVYRRALEFFEKGLALSRSDHLDRETAVILQYMAKTYNALGEEDASRACLLEAARLSEVAVNLRVNIAENLLSRGGYREAADSLRALLPEFDNRPLEQPYVLYLLAQAEKALGNIGEARQLIEQTLEQTEALAERMATRKQRLQFQAQRFNENRFYLDVLVADKSEPHAMEAFYFSANSRMAMLDPFAPLSGKVSESHENQARQLADQINELAWKATPDQSEAILRLQNRYAQVLDEMWELTKPTALPFEQNQDPRTFLAADEKLLYLALGLDSAYAWFFHGNGEVRFHQMTDVANLDALARDIYDRLKHSPKSNDQGLDGALATRLSQALLAPFADLLSDGHLYVIADGGFNVLPFEVLPMPGRADRLLIESCAVSYVSSLGDLVKRQQPKQPLDDYLLMVSNPYFGKDFNPLTGFRNEADAILKSARSAGYEVGFLNGLKATRDGFFNHPQLKSAALIHLSTHGLYMQDWPELSALVLSTRDQEGRSRPGYLRIQDIHHLALDARLVVLSACETALGREIPGAGTMGFANAFLQAGAQGCIVSLWPVNDAATEALMVKFYQQYFKAPQDPVAALALAKRWLAKQSPWQHPYYWAGFVYQGT